MRTTSQDLDDAIVATTKRLAEVRADLAIHPHWWVFTRSGEARTTEKLQLLLKLNELRSQQRLERLP